MELILNSLEDLPVAAKQFIEVFKRPTVFAFEAEMGNGKTTFINEVCRQLGVEDETSSPTYSIVNEYLGHPGTIYHMDAYRIESEEEAFESGIEEYLYSNNYCFIEWPSKIEGLLPPEVVKVFINLGKDNQRIIRVEYEKRDKN